MRSMTKRRNMARIALPAAFLLAVAGCETEDEAVPEQVDEDVEVVPEVDPETDPEDPDVEVDEEG